MSTLTPTETEVIGHEDLSAPDSSASGQADTSAWHGRHPGGHKAMSVRVRPACLQDGVAVLDLLEEVGYYPEPIAFAKTYRKSIGDPLHLVRVAEVEGKIVGMATLSLRHQLGLGGLLASLDELVIKP